MKYKNIVEIQMNVKAMAFLARKDQIISDFGEDRWNTFLETIIKSHPKFKDYILPTSKIPLEEFMTLQGLMVTEFYNGDETIYWKFGEESARQSMSEGGVFHVYMKRKTDPVFFITKILPGVWNLYYDEGSIKNIVEGNVIHSRILDLPRYYLYFELMVMGYAQCVFELLGIKIIDRIKVKSSARETYYKFITDLNSEKR